MNRRDRMTTGVMLAIMMAACSPAPQPAAEPGGAADESAPYISEPTPAAESPGAVPTQPAGDLPAPGAPPASMVVYTCDDGRDLTVTYDEYSAMVKLPTGSTALPLAESVSGNGDDAYLGEELSLYRSGHRVQLLGAGKPRTCTASSG